MISDPDYSQYSYDRLIDVLANIDGARFPERKAAAETALRDRFPGGRPATPASEFGRYETFWPRLGAAIVDGIVVMIAAGLGIWLLASTVGLQNTTAILIFNIVAALAVYAYSISMHAAYGQTLGKMAANVKVLRASDESRIGLRHALLRDSVPLSIEVGAACVVAFAIFYGAAKQQVSDLAMALIEGTSAVWFLTEIVTMLLNKKRRALHDFIAGTVVVNVQSARE